MPNFSGTWKMKSSENFDELLKALAEEAGRGLQARGGHQTDRDHFSIKTSTTAHTTQSHFLVGQEFIEETLDGRKCQSLAAWETENKMHCRQTLLRAEQQLMGL